MNIFLFLLLACFPKESSKTTCALRLCFLRVALALLHWIEAFMNFIHVFIDSLMLLFIPCGFIRQLLYDLVYIIYKVFYFSESESNSWRLEIVFPVWILTPVKLNQIQELIRHCYQKLKWLWIYTVLSLMSSLACLPRNMVRITFLFLF